MSNYINISPHEHVAMGEEIQQALASLRLEGIVLSKESIDDLKCFVAGKLSKDDVIKRALARIRG